jgi:hypothetical protein
MRRNVPLDPTNRESAILYDPYQDQVSIFGEQALPQVPPTIYTHTERQYNVRIMN